MGRYRQAWINLPQNVLHDDSYRDLQTADGCASYRRWLARDTSLDAATQHQDFAQFYADETDAYGYPLHDSPGVEREVRMHAGGGSGSRDPMCFVVYDKRLPCYYDTQCIMPPLPDDDPRVIVVRLPFFRERQLAISQTVPEVCGEAMSVGGGQ